MQILRGLSLVLVAAFLALPSSALLAESPGQQPESVEGAQTITNISFDEIPEGTTIVGGNAAITLSGDVGIGTSTPNSPLTVVGTIESTPVVFVSRMDPSSSRPEVEVLPMALSPQTVVSTTTAFPRSPTSRTSSRSASRTAPC